MNDDEPVFVPVGDGVIVAMTIDADGRGIETWDWACVKCGIALCFPGRSKTREQAHRYAVNHRANDHGLRR